jgi:hypothetical protein
MAETIIVTEINQTVQVDENTTVIQIATTGPQGPSGRTILNGSGNPSDATGAIGDFYYDTTGYKFWGPKISLGNGSSTGTWTGSTIIPFNEPVSFEYSWDSMTLHQSGEYRVTINHGLNFRPNVTVKTSGGAVLETGIEYNNLSTLTLSASANFSGTAYLS